MIQPLSRSVLQQAPQQGAQFIQPQFSSQVNQQQVIKREPASRMKKSAVVFVNSGQVSQIPNLVQTSQVIQMGRPVQVVGNQGMGSREEV
jgi:hypothetical protein